jgi:PadR family transcriptional regulator, regulatory protein PadR
VSPELDELAGTPRNYLRPCLLLLIAEQPSYGYDLLERLAEVGVARTEPGRLYRSLRAMEQEGLVRSRWEASEVGPPRRTYQLTEEGADWLHVWAGSLRETRRIVSLFLRRYDALAAGVGRRSPGHANVTFQ